MNMGTAINHAAAIKRLEALFDDVQIETKPKPTVPEIHIEVEHQHNVRCDVHGKNGTRRGSLGNILHATNRRDVHKKDQHGYGVGPRRESMPALNVPNSYRYRPVNYLTN